MWIMDLKEVHYLSVTSVATTGMFNQKNSNVTLQVMPEEMSGHH